MGYLGSRFGLIGSGSAMGGGGLYPPAGKINADLDVFLTLEADVAVVRKAQATLDIILDTEPQAIDFKAVSANLDIVLDSDATAVAGGYNFGNCLLFDGSNDYVDLGQTYIPFTNRTLSVWFYYTGSAWSNTILVNSSSSRVIRLVSTTSIRVFGGSVADFTVPTMSTNTWYHVMVAVDASNNGRLYLNGTESSSGSLAVGSTLNVQRIGWTNTSTWDGRLDDLFFSASGVLGDATDAAAIYNSGAGASPEDSLGTGDYWLKFNESGTDTTAADEYGGTGSTLNNFPSSGMWIDHNS